jgi:hypothetical protein
MDGRRWVTALLGIFGICLFFGGCASDQGAKANIANADMAIQRAQEANAINLAPLELRLAEEKLQQATSASQHDGTKEARRLADEAVADAPTAEAKSRAVQTAQIEQQMRRDVSALRQVTPGPPPAPAPMSR